MIFENETIFFGHRMASGGLDLSGKGASVIAAALGLIICLFLVAVLTIAIIGPRGFQSMRGVLNLLVATGIIPASAVTQAAPFQRVVDQGAREGARPPARGRQGPAGAAANDATRPPVPGWDPVLRVSSQDLVGLDPDDAVDRALGRSPGHSAVAPIPVLAGGQLAFVPPAALVAGPSAAAGASNTQPTGAAQANPSPATSGTAPAGPIRQVLAPPVGARPPLPAFAIELAFFLDPQEATRFAAALEGRGIAVRLLDQLDEAGRNWTYVRSPIFTDSVLALAFASQVERSLGLRTTLVTEPLPPREGGG